jgi:hypothetical protein
MKPTPAELEFLYAWAREEWQPACYQLPAHRLQLTNGVSGAQLSVFIKAWVAAEGKKDQDILQAARNPQPHWPPRTSMAGLPKHRAFPTSETERHKSPYHANRKHATSC